MVPLCQANKISNLTLSKSKIPDYARDYRNEYLFIIGINKKCGELEKKLGREDLFKSSQAGSLMTNFNRFLKAIEIGYLNDTSKILFKFNDVKSIKFLEVQLDDYIDYYYDIDICKFNQEKYDNNVESDFPGLKRFFECFSRFNDKINVDEVSEEEYYKSIIFDSDSDSDSDYSD